GARSSPGHRRPLTAAAWAGRWEIQATGRERPDTRGQLDPRGRTASSLQELGLTPAVYRRVLCPGCLVQQADQLVEARGQDDDEPRWLRPGVPESMRDARRHEHGGTSPGDDLSVREPEAQRPGHHMPRLVIRVVDMKGRNLARQPFSRPVLYHQIRAPHSQARSIT